MFKIGQKVVCKDASNQVNNFKILNYVSKGKVYTIREIKEFSNETGLIFEEFVHGYHWNGEEAGFRASRFEPLKYDLLDNKDIISELVKERADIKIPELVEN